MVDFGRRTHSPQQGGSHAEYQGSHQQPDDQLRHPCRRSPLPGERYHLLHPALHQPRSCPASQLGGYDR